MKHIFKTSILHVVIALTISSCKSSVEVINAWKSEKLNTLTEKNILVITRTENNKKRGAFEEQMVAYLKKKNIKASTSYMKIPIFNDQREYTDDERKELVKKIRSLGFNAIILTSVKKRTQKTVTTRHGGYYTGGSYSSLYPQYYGGFYGYYNHPYSHPTYQSYVPSETYTDIRKSFVLETVIFNLDLSSTEQLVAVVTSAINDPETVYTAAEEYVKEIAKSLRK
jgi:hypothetical protein